MMNEWMNDHDFLLWINRWYGRRPWWVFRDILGGGRKQVIRLTVGREGERGEVEHDKIISIYIYLYLFSKVTQLLFRKTRQVVTIMPETCYTILEHIIPFANSWKNSLWFWKQCNKVTLSHCIIVYYMYIYISERERERQKLTTLLLLECVLLPCQPLD